MSPASPLSSTEELLDEIRAGRMVVLMDDEDRENEGDLIMAAVHVRPQDINFMATHGRGLICLPLPRARCHQLRLPLMVPGTDVDGRTNFTLSIDAAQGISTGISAHDRARAVQVAMAPEAKPEDLISPGHIFPLIAMDGGVLVRPGHTEAGCDLTRLAGLEPGAVIVEVLRDDGDMARRPDLEQFAIRHHLRMGTIADLIHYRLRHESTVTRVGVTTLETIHGTFEMVIFQDLISGMHHVALVHGVVAGDRATLVRVHVANTYHELLALHQERMDWSLDDALAAIVREGSGIAIILHSRDNPFGIPSHLVQILAGGGKPGSLLGAADQAKPAVESAAVALRQYGVGAQILRDLGVRRLRVLGHKRHMAALGGFGLEVIQWLETPPIASQPILLP
jgi:3,4-dihydroxy 2-butanone 4-phosphate synthase/GTP cyclohydrolase II